MVPGRAHPPPQRRHNFMDFECHNLETIWQEKLTRKVTSGEETTWTNTAFAQPRDTTAAQWWWRLAPARLSGTWRCRSSLSDRLKSEVALCGELLESSMIHNIWKPAHGIPTSGTCICHVSRCMETGIIFVYIQMQFASVYSAANECQHCWDGSCDELASCPGESVQLHSKLAFGWHLSEWHWRRGMYITKGNCEHIVSALRQSPPSSLMYRVSMLSGMLLWENVSVVLGHKHVHWAYMLYGICLVFISRYPLFRKLRISIQTKINMYRALVVSVLLYGSEAWATTIADRRRLDVFDMRCQMRLLPVLWQQHISNHSIRERTKQPTASSLLRQRRLRWFGHLHRMPSSLPARRVYDFNPNIHGWKRPRGRPKTRSPDSIKHDLNSAGLNTTNAAQMVFDQPQWKAFVSGLPTLEPEQGS